MGLGATSSLLWNRRPIKWCLSDPDDPEVPDDTSVELVRNLVAHGDAREGK